MARKMLAAALHVYARSDTMRTIAVMQRCRGRAILLTARFQYICYDDGQRKRWLRTANDNYFLPHADDIDFRGLFQFLSLLSMPNA